MKISEMVLGNKYNWKSQPERLIYLGCNWSGNGYWHQFAKVESPSIVWSEVLDSELFMIEETIEGDFKQFPVGYISNSQRKKALAERFNQNYDREVIR